MRGLQKSKRVSWASDVNLCQVRLFLSEESPSLVGLGAQDHLQEKTSSEVGIDDNLPPGFEGAAPANLLKNKLSQIPLIKWKRLLKFVLDPTWLVVAGEESEEVDVQNQREMRVLEAVYPRASAIPPNPVLIAVEDSSHLNDQNTTLIPITPIEDEDSTAENTVSISASEKSETTPSFSGLVEPDIVAAAYAALTSARTTGGDQAYLIDPDLLTKILTNPNLIEKLGASIGSTSTPTGPFQPPQGSILQPPQPEVSPAPPQPLGPKDINYYKSLIQQHGGDKQESTNVVPKSREIKPKIMKPCIYFNSSRGCRHGTNCVYQHDGLAQARVGSPVPEVQSSKRMKTDREITRS